MPKSNTLLWVNELNGGYYLECPPLEIYASGEETQKILLGDELQDGTAEPLNPKYDGDDD